MLSIFNTFKIGFFPILERTSFLGHSNAVVVTIYLITRNKHLMVLKWFYYKTGQLRSN